MNMFLSRLVRLAALVVFGASMGIAQEIGSTEIFSAIRTDGDTVRFETENRHKSCFNFVKMEHSCGSGVPMIQYGNRFGDNWDIFTVTGPRQDQTRGVDLGKLQWSDDFEVPEIEPWPKLRTGETRHITVNTSGADGAHGRPGRNADGTFPREGRRPPVSEGFADKPVDRQVQTAVQTNKGSVPSAYNPYLQIKQGHIYAFRVVDEQNDFYLLMRIDDLLRGTKAFVSYKKVDVIPK